MSVFAKKYRSFFILTITERYIEKSMEYVNGCETHEKMQPKRNALVPSRSWSL